MDSASQLDSGSRPDSGSRIDRKVAPGGNAIQFPRTKEIQAFATVEATVSGLDEKTCKESVSLMNEVLADTFMLRDLYKKHHWQLSGPTFYQLHLLFDKHYDEQVELVDILAERIQALGGISFAMPHDIVEATRIPRAPRGREDAPTQISRLLEAHSLLLQYVRQSARRAAEIGDDGTNDVLVSDVLRTNEQQAWFLQEHLKNVSLLAGGQ